MQILIEKSYNNLNQIAKRVNTVSEATNKILKTKFVYQKNFEKYDKRVIRDKGLGLHIWHITKKIINLFYGQVTEN